MDDKHLESDPLVKVELPIIRAAILAIEHAWESNSDVTEATRQIGELLGGLPHPEAMSAASQSLVRKAVIEKIKLDKINLESTRTALVAFRAILENIRKQIPELTEGK